MTPTQLTTLNSTLREMNSCLSWLKKQSERPKHVTDIAIYSPDGTGGAINVILPPDLAAQVVRDFAKRLSTILETGGVDLPKDYAALVLGEEADAT